MLLGTDWRASFARDGYAIFEGFLTPEHSASLRADLDALMERRAVGEAPLVVSFPALGRLTSHPETVDMILPLMGGTCAMHHIHATRQDAGFRGVDWHHDYEQHPQTNRSHLMVHVFYYLDGLNGEVGDLLVLPASQHMVLERRGLGIFGTADLPGSLTVDALAPGSAVLVHSALIHARRPKPGGEGRPRYFVDVSYCQHGVRWPAYPSVERIDELALQMGHDRDGRYAFLYDSSQFFDAVVAQTLFDATYGEGSLADRLTMS